jgi:hypothetical protein
MYFFFFCSSYLGRRQVAGFYEHSNETLGSITGGALLDQLSDC